jgi:hypothetical protein
LSGTDPLVARRTAASQIDAATRICIRTAAARRLFPSGRTHFDNADVKEAKALLDELS